MIPFTGQPSKNPVQSKTEQSSHKTVKAPSLGDISFKKEVKTLSSPTGTLTSGLISVKEIMEKKEAKESIENFENKPKSPFTLDDLMIYWRKFAFKMKEDGNDTIYLAMKKRDPKLANDFVIIHEVDNQVQIDYIQTHITDLLDFLRENLKNWGISVKFSITEAEDENIKFQTGKDKFAVLARKNPNLYTLQKLFNLDIEY